MVSGDAVVELLVQLRRREPGGHAYLAHGRGQRLLLVVPDVNAGPGGLIAIRRLLPTTIDRARIADWIQTSPVHAVVAAAPTFKGGRRGDAPRAHEFIALTDTGRAEADRHVD